MAAVAVIGGGVTGLTAGYRLQQRGCRVVVYEAGEQVGGAVRTLRRDGYLAELGPGTLSTSSEVAGLLAELELEPSRLTVSPLARHRYIVRRGKLVPLPATPGELLTTRLLSSTAKLAVFTEPLVEAGDAKGDESVAAFVRRRFNQEVVDYIANPYVAGIFAGDPEQLSVRHAMPQLHDLERNHGSLVKALMRRKKSGDRGSGSPAPQLSFRNGLQEIPDALGRRLTSEVRLRAPVTQLRRGPRGWMVGAAFQAPEFYDGVIYAAPAYALDEIDLDLPGGERLATLSSIDHPPVAVIALGFIRDQVSHPLDGFGFLSPEIERRRVLGVVFSSTLFENRAPEDQVLLTAFAGGTRDPDFTQSDPDTMTARVLDELRSLLGVRGEPVFKAVQVWPKAIPQYVLGYGRFKEIADQVERTSPGFVLAGTYRDGISLAQAIASGEGAASRLGEVLGVSPVAANEGRG